MIYIYTSAGSNFWDKISDKQINNRCEILNVKKRTNVFFFTSIHKIFLVNYQI